MSKGLRFALEVWGRDWAQLHRTCRLAERLGYDALYYGESPTGLNLDCWTALAALAQSTRTLRIGPVIANLLPSYRSLALLAKQAATVSLLSDGRLDFRTGAGAARREGAAWWEPFGVEYPGHATRLERLEDAVPLLRALWAGERARLPGGDPGGVELGWRSPPIPITLAATGPSGLACAARHADVWEASYRTADEFAELSARFDALRQDAARPPLRALEVDVFIAPDARGADELLDEVRRQRGADGPRVIERSLHGTPDQVAAQVSRLASAGVDQLLLAFHDPHDATALETFAEVMGDFAVRAER